MPIRRVAAVLGLALVTISAQGVGQQADSSLLSVQRIFGSTDFRSESFGPSRWLGAGSYTTLEPAPAPTKGTDLVRYDIESGAREVLVPAARLIPPGDTVPLAVEDYVWAPDGAQLLIFTNSKPVWRTNTRGDYWVYNRSTGALRRLGADARPSTLMFAKFSPDGRRVGYVRENNLYVEDLAGDGIRQLTHDGSGTIINGTFDWVYEEELGLRDGWRWSPDGATIAFWQLVADSVRSFDLLDNTDSLYSFVVPVQYPKAGEPNSAARVGVVPATGGNVRWLDVPGDPRNNYIARMEWAESSDELVIQHLNRLQNTDDVLIADRRTGAVRKILSEHDSAWVSVVNDLRWLDRGRSFLWLSERDGWQHAYVVSRDGGKTRLITPGAFDVLGIVGLDEKAGWLYFVASPDHPTQRYLYRVPLSGKGAAQRLTPASASGTNGYDVSPDLRYALHTWSNFESPPTIELVRLPSHQTVRPLVKNAALRAKLASLRAGPHEFFQVDIGDGVRLNGWIMKPAGFDPARKYPILFSVYGGPGSQTVLDSWGGPNYLWHMMLTQKGYLVASVDNRGTGARGRDWKKIVYGRLGVIETHDQAAAARVIGGWPYVDASRIGVWGWSYGGFMSLNTLFQAPDVYRMGIAVAPVTHWKFYDNIYTERYNGLPQQNPEGYDRGSPLTYVNQLKGSLLLVHGTGDDNVHLQNSQVLINALVAANKPFSFMEYPNRNHGIFGGNTRVHLFELLTRFVDENLGSPAVTSRTPAVGDARPSSR
ncbi:MAG: S9 family peptidase [Gemmatimonadota bacterium]